MLNKIMTNIKNIGLVLILLFGILSCEKDFEDIAVNLVDNSKFSVGDTIIEIKSYTANIEINRVDNNNPLYQPLSVLGFKKDNNFGTSKGAIISQLNLPIFSVNFGDNPIIDKVVLDIPYYATSEGKDSIKDSEGTLIQVRPKFSLDSIYGDQSKSYNITVNELGTFLNSLDPEDPTMTKLYYSDKDFIKLDQIYSGDFTPNKNDTVLYVKRDFLYPQDTLNIDTIKTADAKPSAKFMLDENFFKTRFVDHDGSSDFENNDNFKKYFRGLYIDANGFEGSMMNLDISKAKVTIYFTNDEIKDEGTDEDLNFNGITGETGVIAKIKKSLSFALGGVKANNYENDYSGSLADNAILNPDKINGEKKLYIQGAAGTEAIIDLFTEETLTDLRSKNLLINDAILTFYVDGDGEQTEVPQRLLLYNKEYNSFITDYYSTLFFGPDIFDGKLVYKTVLDKEVPDKYTFRITKYISKILDASNPIEPSKLALKSFISSDNLGVLFDTIKKDYNWIPKGVVLKGNSPDNGDKRVKLELFYSK